MHTHSINNLLGLKDVIVRKISQTEHLIQVFIETNPKPHTCPACGQVTSKIHDYRTQVIKDLPALRKQLVLVLRKRRYVCQCGKKFYESYSFLPKYHRMTNRLSAHLCEEMRKCIPISMIAKDSGVSTHTVSRIFNFVKYPKARKMPKVLCIDEFKGNTNAGKYQCLLVDGETHEVLDVLPNRNKNTLLRYFLSIPRYERLKVKFFVCDMCGNFAQVARDLFPNATIIVDKYHFVRQVTWAVENVRKRIQKTMLPYLRKYFKRSKSLILKHRSELKSHEKEALDVMLTYSDDLRQAYNLKEKFYELCGESNFEKQKVLFGKWILYAQNTRLKEFNACITAFCNWSKEILNSFKYNYSNGPTEGTNNKIKVLKRVCYGFRNFDRLRNRILHLE